MTRGLDELVRLAVHLGANPLTLQGLSGVGDLILTCCGDLSSKYDFISMEKFGFAQIRKNFAYHLKI